MRNLVRKLVRGKVTQKGNNNVAIQNSIVKIGGIGEDIQRLMSEGKPIEAMALFNSMMKNVSSQHPMYPHWRYDVSIEEGQIRLAHVPTSVEAAQHFPLKGNIKVVIPEEYKDFKNIGQLLQYSYGKQMKLELNANAFKTWIGDQLIEDFESGSERSIKVTIEPKPFPDPIPVKLYIKESSSSIDYLEMGVTEIDGNIITLDNSKQENPKIKFSLKINLEDYSAKFNLIISEEYRHDVEANLLVNQFLMEVNEGGSFALKDLKNGVDFLVSNQHTLDEPLGSQHNDFVRLLSDLITLEEYYGVKFELKEDISDEDIEKVHILKLAMQGQKREGKYTDFCFNIDSPETIKNILEAYDSNESRQWGTKSHNKVIHLFGETISFSEYRVEFHNAKLKDEDRIRKKYELMTEGETVIVKFVPIQDEDNVFYEYYIFSKSHE